MDKVLGRVTVDTYQSDWRCTKTYSDCSKIHQRQHKVSSCDHQHLDQVLNEAMWTICGQKKQLWVYNVLEMWCSPNTMQKFFFFIKTKYFLKKRGRKKQRKKRAEQKSTVSPKVCYTQLRKGNTVSGALISKHDTGSWNWCLYSHFKEGKEFNFNSTPSTHGPGYHYWQVHVITKTPIK